MYAVGLLKAGLEEKGLRRSALLDGALRYFRSRRMRLFFKTFQVSSDTRILDVGGSPEIWDLATVRPRLTFVNLPSAVERSRRGLWVAADGCQLPFRDAEFDIAFSNSVIEHVGTASSQQRFAAEVVRVSKQYWVQTPDRMAPFEMHSMLPLVHFLPKSWQTILIRHLSPWQLMASPTADQREHFFAHVLHDLRLLDRRDMKAFFPEARILRERLLGIPKSLVAVKK